MNRPLRISTPADLSELIDRATMQGPMGELEPPRDAPSTSSRAAVAVAPSWAWLTRDLLTSSNNAGAYTVGPSTPIIDAATSLRGFSVVLDAGATVVEPPAGTANISISATAPTASWVSENSADTPSEPVFGAPLALTPATLRITAVASRRLLKMSPTAERMVRHELLEAVGRAVDTAALGAGGGAAPVGLAGTTGRITQSGATLSWATLAGVERQVLAAGVRAERLRYITTPSVRELLVKRERAAGSLHIIESDRIGAVPVSASNEAPSGAMFVGDWSGLVVAFYGGRPVVFVNPYRYGTSGLVEFTVHVEVGIGYPRPPAFAHISSIT